MSCSSQEALAAFVDADPSAASSAVASHVAICTRCATELGVLRAVAEELRRPVIGALGNRSPEAFANDVMGALDRPRTLAPRRARWTYLLVAALLPLIFAGAWLHDRSRRGGDTFAARGGAQTAGVERVLVRFGRVVGTTFEPLVDGAALERDAVLAAEIGGVEADARYLLAFLVDSGGERHWIYPAYEAEGPSPSAMRLPISMTGQVLDSMVRLDRPASGPARLVAIVLPAPETVDYVEHASQGELERKRLSTHYRESLVTITSVVVR